MVFKQIFKGIKTGIKGIARGVKKAFRSFGKFMGKIGILGQVAMMFIMPYIGQALGSLWTSAMGQTAAQQAAAAAGTQAGTAATNAALAEGATQAAAKATGEAVAAAATKNFTAEYAAASVAKQTSMTTGFKASGLLGGETAFARGVGKVMEFTSNTVGKVGNTFTNLTKGITDTLTNFAKTASNNIFGTSFDAASSFFGPGDSAFSRSFGADSRFQNLFQDSRLFDAKGSLTNQGQRYLDSVNNLPNDLAYDSSGFRDVSQTEYFGETNFDQRPDYRTADASGTPPPSPTPEMSVGEKTVQAAKDYGSLSPEQVINTFDGMTYGGGKAGNLTFGMGGNTYNMSLESFNKLPLADQETLKLLSTGKTQTLMGTLAEGVTNIPTQIREGIRDSFANPGQKIMQGTTETITSGLKTRGLQEIGILEKPVYNVENISNVAYVPSLDSFSGGPIQTPDIELSPQLFQTNVMENTSPWGYTAFQYGQYMAQKA